jgi:uncharacterized protein
MKVPFSEISAAGTKYSLKDTGWFPAEDFRLLHLHHVSIDLLKESHEKVVLKGDMAASVEFVCDRCGEPFVATLNCDFFYIFITGVDTSMHLQDKECSKEDCSTVYLDEPVVDIGEILREQTLLAAPERRICDEGCLGLCPKCGENLARNACACSLDRSDSPFAVLKNFKKH